jgi:hypothetical protein
LINQNISFMQDEVKISKRGGVREGSGRKPKAAELALAEQMDKVAPCEQVLNALYHKVLEGDTAAIKLWLNYRLGMPVQRVEQETKVDINSFNIKDVVEFNDSPKLEV